MIRILGKNVKGDVVRKIEFMLGLRPDEQIGENLTAILSTPGVASAEVERIPNYLMAQ